jgi:hypothetical protein
LVRDSIDPGCYVFNNGQLGQKYQNLENLHNFQNVRNIELHGPEKLELDEIEAKVEIKKEA